MSWDVPEEGGERNRRRKPIQNYHLKCSLHIPIDLIYGLLIGNTGRKLVEQNIYNEKYMLLWICQIRHDVAK